MGENKSLIFERVGYIQNSVSDIVTNWAETTVEINGPISFSEAMHFCNDLGLIQSLDVPIAYIRKQFEEKEVINTAESLINFLNASAPFENDQNSFQIAD